MIFTDNTANIHLKSCDHTAHRVCQIQNHVICMIEQYDLATFHYKAIFDASTC